MSQKNAATALVLLMVFAAFPLGVLGQGETSVKISQVMPSSASAGSQVRLQGSIATYNGSYQVLIAKLIVTSGLASGYTVNANFTVPELLAASYPLILRDVAKGVDSYGDFKVTTGYSVTPSSSTVQEGSNIVLSVTVTGAQLGTPYDGNLAVTTPNGKTYLAPISLSIPNTKGTASAEVTFPDSFSPAGATTAYTGVYRVAFGENLASTQFNARFMDANSYHRGDVIKIHAVGYQPNQATTITITSSSSTWNDIKSIAASPNGIIETAWTVSSTIPMGECTVKIIPDGTAKIPADQQSFTIIGYTTQVEVNKLSNQPIPNVIVQAIDPTNQATTNSTTNATGIATFRLEKGLYTLIAYLNGINVGQKDVTITGDNTFSLTCNIADLTISALTVDGIPLPFVNLAIKYNYQSGTIARSGSLTGQTGPSGAYTLVSALAGAMYTIDASLYGQVFNVNNNTVTTPFDESNSYVTLICPKRNVTMTITGQAYEPIPNVRLELVELTSGLFYSAAADTNGIANMEPTFGMYRVRVYKDNVLINQVNLQVFNSSQKEVRCALYGIQLSVAVVDFFGSPIPNANVTLNGPEKKVSLTRGNGKATFDNIIGGSMQIIAQPQGEQEASQAITVDVDESKTVQLKIDRYVAVGGLLFQASALISFIILFIGLILLIVVEFIVRRRKSKTLNNL